MCVKSEVSYTGVSNRKWREEQEVEGSYRKWKGGTGSEGEEQEEEGRYRKWRGGTGRGREEKEEEGGYRK